MKIASNGIDIHITDSGAGATALVFLHYWGGSSLEWSEVIERLAGEFRCVALDGRGQGDSEAPGSGYGANDLADDALGVVRALGLRKYVLVGHSMGGKTAQVLASRRPPGLAGVALIASSPAAPMQIGEEQRAQMTKAYASREAIDWTLDNVLIGSPTAGRARAQAVKDALRVSPQAVAGWLDIGTREDFSRDVAAVDVPVVIVTGERDRVDPLAVVRSHIVPCYPQAALHVLPGKGHLLPIEAPAEVAGIVRAFASDL